jgi:adenylylsulfate reductase subunit B
MSITMNQALCKGCKACEQVCPGSLIKMNEAGKAYIKYPKDCWGCASCVKECPVGAIGFFLGADIGGNGSVMTVTKDGQILRWNIHKSDGREVTIEVDRRSSNKY